MNRVQPCEASESFSYVRTPCTLGMCACTCIHERSHPPTGSLRCRHRFCAWREMRRFYGIEAQHGSGDALYDMACICFYYPSRAQDVPILPPLAYYMFFGMILCLGTSTCGRIARRAVLCCDTECETVEARWSLTFFFFGFLAAFRLEEKNSRQYFPLFPQVQSTQEHSTVFFTG